MSDMTDGIIDLNFGGVEAIEGGFQPIPAGIYKFIIHEPTLEESKAKTGMNIKFSAVVADGDHIGRSLRQSWFVPNAPQNPNEEAVKKYKTTMGFLLSKLQSVYGTLPENYKLNIRDMAGREFVSVVVIKTSAQFGDQNDVITYLPPGSDVSKIHVPSEPIQDRRTNGDAAQEPSSPGRFKI